MRHVRFFAGAIALLVASASASHAQQTILFNTDPFLGSTALTTFGRQIVGGEPEITFNTAIDIFSFDAGVFNIGSISFANGIITSIPTTGANTIVLQTIDNDSDAGTPFGAGNAANLIADRITQSGAGFFIYFNSGLTMARLVYSTDLSDNTADLKILARLTNITTPGALASFTSANFQIASTTVPEPSSVLMVAVGLLVMGVRWKARQNRVASC